jgi:hypothetical protein
VGSGRHPTLTERDGAGKTTVGGDTRADRWGAAGLNRVAVLVQHEREPEDRTLGHLDTRDLQDLGDDALVERADLTAGGRHVGLKGGLGPHHHVGPRGQTGVQLTEGLHHGVGQHKRARHEGDADRHCRDGQEQAQLVDQQVAKRNLEHD